MILIAVGDCFEAFLAAAIVAAMERRAVQFRAACSRRDIGHLMSLPPEQLLLGAEGPDMPAFVERALAVGPTCVAIVGGSAFALAVAARAREKGLRTIHLDAGVRTVGGRGDAGRRAADTAANEWLVASEPERRELLREGCAHHAVRTVGSLLAAAVSEHVGATTPRFGDESPHGDRPFAHVALEHQQTPPGLPAALAGAGLLPRSSATDLPANRATVELDLTIEASLLVTDSVGHQRLAHATGLPCVVLPGAALWAPGIATGRATQAGFGDGELAAAIARAARAARLPANPGDGVADHIVDALLAPPPAAAPALPSDADASGRTFGDDEIALVTSVLRSGTLNSTRGTFVTMFEQRFAQWLGRKHAIACASGSAAVHCAIAALRLQPGDEVITTPITDMGALTPILYEGAVPVFADVEPVSLNVTAASIRAQLSERTRAIVVTHLFGLPCDMAPILALAKQRSIPVIEDAAQAFGATIGDHKAGALGALAAFSLQQGKHITTGEGGIVATDDDALARRVFLFVNKAWGYGDAKPDHYFPALNYRLTELQGAVAVAQLPKLDSVVAQRRAVANALRDALAGVRGLRLPHDPPHGTHSYWKFAFQVDPTVIPGGAPALGKRMQAAGIACVPRYIQKPAFECELFADWRKSPVTWLPLQHNPRRERAAAMFTRADYPGAVKALDDVIVLPINERYLPPHVELVAGAIRAAVQELTRG